jgi:hypothetical protein
MPVHTVPLSAADIKACDEAIRTLERVLEQYKNLLSAACKESEGTAQGGQQIPQQQSYVQLAIALLEEIGRPTPITVLLERIRERRNDPTITRGSVETSLLRHLSAKGENTEFVKPCPGTYALKQHLEGLR